MWHRQLASTQVGPSHTDHGSIRRGCRKLPATLTVRRTPWRMAAAIPPQTGNCSARAAGCRPKAADATAPRAWQLRSEERAVQLLMLISKTNYQDSDIRYHLQKRCSLHNSFTSVSVYVERRQRSEAHPVVAKAQQQPQGAPLTCWSLMGPTAPLARQSTCLGGLMWRYRYSSIDGAFDLSPAKVSSSALARRGNQSCLRYGPCKTPALALCRVCRTAPQDTPCCDASRGVTADHAPLQGVLLRYTAQ